MMNTVIPVVLKDGTEHLASKDELQRLMTAQEVMFFKRTDGWVVIGRDKTRGSGGHYQGKNRREDCKVSVQMYRY